MINLEDLQPKLLEELQKQSDLNASINKLAHKHGAKIEAKGPNAVLFLGKKLEELLVLKKELRDLGYASPKTALVTLKRSFRPSPVEWTRHVPKDLRRAPNHWSTHDDLVEKSVQTPTGEVVALDCRHSRRFHITLSPYQAQTQLERLLPQLGELFAIADEQFEHEVRQLFFNPETPFKEFEKTVSKRFHELTNPPLNDFSCQQRSTTL